MDNDYSTVWATDGTGEIWLDLGQKVRFNTVYIAWEYNMAHPGFVIEGSNDGNSWTNIYTTSQANNINEAFFKANTNTQEYRFIKLKTTDVNNEARTGIAEIFVYQNE